MAGAVPEHCTIVPRGNRFVAYYASGGVIGEHRIGSADTWDDAARMCREYVAVIARAARESKGTEG